MPITVMKHLQTLALVPILAAASLFFKTISSHPVLTGPDLAYIGSRVTFLCHAPDSSPPITYDLLKDGDVPVAVNVVYKGNQSVLFFLKVTATLEGSYHCRATAGGRTGLSNSVQLSVATPPSNTRVFSEPFPPVAYEGSRFVLSCNATKGSHLSYTWFFNKREMTWSSSFAKASGNVLTMEKVTLQHAGYYSCMAWSRVQNTKRFSSSTEVLLTVKVYVSKPRISFSISKEGDNYLGNVTCWSSKGTPPVNISLTLDDKEVGRSTATDSLAAWFPVAMVPGLDMGVAQCRATNQVQDLRSEPVVLVVVPVGGDVIVEVDYLYGVDSKLAAARLSCRIGRGTFPHVSWLLNASVLLSETPADPHRQPLLSRYGLADNGRTLFLTSLGPEESGYYRCRVRDGYDGSGPWVESEAVLVKVTDKALNSSPAAASPVETPKVPMTTIESITIAFCCLLLLSLALSVGCLYKMYLQAHSHSASNYEAFHLSSSMSQSRPAEDITYFTDSDVQNRSERCQGNPQDCG